MPLTIDSPNLPWPVKRLCYRGQRRVPAHGSTFSAIQVIVSNNVLIRWSPLHQLVCEIAAIEEFSARTAVYTDCRTGWLTSLSATLDRNQADVARIHVQNQLRRRPAITLPNLEMLPTRPISPVVGDLDRLPLNQPSPGGDLESLGLREFPTKASALCCHEHQRPPTAGQHPPHTATRRFFSSPALACGYREIEVQMNAVDQLGQRDPTRPHRDQRNASIDLAD